MKTKDKPQAKQCVIYSRKSKFTGKGESIENQIELCRQYIAMHFGEEAAEHVLVYEDEGFFGDNLERPQFKKMMKDSQKIAFAAIVVYRLDRISRNIGDFAKLIEDLGDRHIDFISIREQFDTSSPMGRAMMYIASVFSQLERGPSPSASGTTCTSYPRPGAGWAARRPPATLPRAYPA